VRSCSPRNFSLSREGQVTDRYAKAMELLGSGKLDVCIGGIYALERIALDSAKDHPTVMEVLTAFVRVHSQEGVAESRTRPDIQAAVTVIGRRDSKNDLWWPASRDGLGRPGHIEDTGRINLSRAVLPGAILVDANLHRAYLMGVKLTNADLSLASFVFADLTDADLTGADLSRANLFGANLTGANLSRANLTGAVLTNAHLTDVRWPSDFRVPEGWQLDTGTGLLKADAARSS